MAATFHLCATHHSGNREGRALLTELAESLPARFRACHVGVFHGDDRAFAQRTIDFLATLGARVAAPRLSDPRVDVAAARAAIESADLLYLDGGDTVAGVTRIRELGLIDAFQRAAKTARALFGLSGGACAAGPYTIGYGDDDAPYVAPSLDLGVPLPLDVHDEREEWPELRALLRLKPPHPAGIAIPSKGVLVVGGDGSLASRGAPACEQRSLTRDGRWKVTPIERSITA